MEFKTKEEIQGALEDLFTILTDTYESIQSTKKFSSAEAKFIRLESLENELKYVRNCITKYNACVTDVSQKIDVRKWAFYDIIDSIRSKYFELKEKKLECEPPLALEPPCQIRLPKLNLPHFSGNTGEWVQFYSMFDSCVNQNKNLSNIEKFQYLKGVVKGDALKLIENLPLSDVNYMVAYNTLIRRYDNKRLLANYYMKQLFDFRGLNNDSPTSLQNFLLVFRTNVNAVKAMNLPDLSDYILFYKALTCLDLNTRQLFESKHQDVEVPTFETLINFVEQRLKVNSICTDVTAKFYSRPNRFPSVLLNRFEPRSNICKLCEKDVHNLYHCSKFFDLSPDERLDFVKKDRYCFNCLSSKHSVAYCKSALTCNSCHQRHHSLLHTEKLLKVEDSSAEKKSDNVSVVLYSKITSRQTVLLPTVTIKIQDCFNKWQSVRFLLDSGSQSNLITLNCCKRLGLSIQNSNTSIKGISAVSQTVQGLCKFTISSRLNQDVKFDIESLIVTYITDNLPEYAIPLENLHWFKNLPLADQTFNQPSTIEGILGASIFAQIIGKKTIKHNAGYCAVDTSLGYVIMGSIPTLNINSTSYTFCITENPSLEELVKRFWELENCESNTLETSDDEICEKIFLSNLKRDKEGKYFVSLPFKEDPSILGTSYENAKRRFLHLEKKLNSDEKMKMEYSEAIKSHINSGYISECKDPNPKEGYYIPHHGVFKLSSSTPLRIVFDASSPTSSSKSLNEILYVGPKLQSDLYSILLRFRLYPVAITADIRQMYLRIGMNDDHKKFHKILWRFDENSALKTYNLNTVTFGIKSSPYLALRTIKQLIIDEGHKYPTACQVVPHDLYIDDLVTSCIDVSEAKTLFYELVNLFKSGNFDLVKWSSNSPELLNFIPSEFRLNENINFESTSFVKILGLQWSPQEDYFTFLVHPQPPEMPCTKRSILSAVARIYDPLGLVTCVTVFAKMMLKELWALKLEWDESPPESLVRSWKQFMKQLPELSKLKIPRYLGVHKNSIIDLIGFCDASQHALGAVVYIRVYIENDTRNLPFLLTSKSKVTPLKNTPTIPRLELCSAFLLSKLLKIVQNCFKNKVTIRKIFAFTDSQVTLGWINSSPQKWKQFVSNRVLNIKENIPSAEWFHVSGNDNPADYISRSIKPARLITQPIWIHGPSWLSDPINTWPISKIETDELCNLEEKKVILCNVVSESCILTLANRCSSWYKLLRVVVYILRFGKKLPKNNFILASDLKRAMIVVLKDVQNRHFFDDLNALQLKKNISSQLQKLSPFFDNGIIRVGGRLANSEADYDSRHPILLPKRDRVVDLIIDDYHKRHLHLGAHSLLNVLRQEFWILAARSTIRKRIRLCNNCFRIKPSNFQPLMGNLPDARVRTSKAFANVGIDYAGPLTISLGPRRRGAKTQKGYIALFVCLATKALHLELASDLSTMTFIAAFKRFLARRGPCHTIYSDCGTNFIGANKYLKEIYSSSDFQNVCASYAIQWKFNPPSAPHFGGLWESQVKAVKTHLLKIIGSRGLSYEELYTVLAQVECVLNSRPLTLLSDNPSDPVALTPAHFLTSSPLQYFPALTVTDISENRLSRPQLLDSVVQHFWKRWRTEYLHTLQVRQKWTSPSRNIEVGTIVLINTENVPPLQWPLGRIIETYPGKDGIVRVATVRTATSVFRRPVCKLCPLPLQ